MLKHITQEKLRAFIEQYETDLMPTHTKLSLPIINRMYRKMVVGIRFPPIKVEGRIICDGHHRYLASLLAGAVIERIPGRTTSATTIVEWASVCIEDSDWDTPREIMLYNVQDAEYNNIVMEEMVALIK